MATDREQLLADLQKASIATGAAAPEPGADEDDGKYHAYKAVDRKQRRLLLQAVHSPSEWVTYQYLLRIVLDERQTKLGLIFSFMAITINGHNLGQIADAVADERCHVIEQFDAKVWKKPIDKNAAIVESIEFITSKPPE